MVVGTGLDQQDQQGKLERRCTATKWIGAKQKGTQFSVGSKSPLKGQQKNPEPNGSQVVFLYGNEGPTKVGSLLQLFLGRKLVLWYWRMPSALL